MTERRVYEAPTVVEIGSVSELTQVVVSKSNDNADGLGFQGTDIDVIDL